MKYGRSSLVTSAGLEDAIATDGPGAAPDAPPEADALADDLERMGPTFIKLGQLLSTRPDILPPAYLASLTRLQDDVKPFSYAEVERIVQEELDVRISRAFPEFDSEPMASASLGQVHRAVMRDGRQVVVKVQRPGIREQIAEDLEALGDIAEFMDKHTESGGRYRFVPMLAEFSKSIKRELDYRQEAQNLATLGRNLESFDRIIVPRPVDDFTTSRVLTMEYISGQKITRLSPLVKLDLDGAELADQLFKAYLRQILIDGFFHADPHPGNVLLTADGNLALIDMGMVAHVTPDTHDALVKRLLAVSGARASQLRVTGVYHASQARSRFTILCLTHMAPWSQKFPTALAISHSFESGASNAARNAGSSLRCERSVQTNSMEARRAGACIA